MAFSVPQVMGMQSPNVAEGMGISGTASPPPEERGHSTAFRRDARRRHG